ncbi:membrane associated rhomboid family serine protease [Halarchaeum solikamskense]|uniref:rhomboid family intramembrane serine protease n=1 Tax=Halarchaeum nitratireducens TaxID=489913 RepID=UPI001B3A816C|nr:rhomboid family intramembrane serine protease [Halarchaeum solikamskense]MBP2252117.1 membrane associated rhomboid family serine protease [Halarchaeum solikamskense]
MLSSVLLAGGAGALCCWLLVVAVVAFGGVRAGTALRVGLPLGPLVGLGCATALGLPPADALAPAVLSGTLVSLACVRALDGVGDEWGRRLRSRFLFGVPWGTLVVVAGVAGFYLFVQQGWTHPNDPLSLPFTSWSYLYPLGVLTAPFAHAGLSHVTGNLLGTLVYAPLAEYAWSHYPTRRGESTFGSLRTNPLARIGAFVLAVAVVAVLTSALAWGPIVGFSGVVFAFGAFALTRYPVGTVVASAASGFASTFYYALRDPVVVASAGPSYGGPWWAGVAVQGHAVGVLVGVLLGALLVAARDERPSALRLWGAAIVYAASVPLYAVWWYRGPSTYVLYRGLGVLLVVALGLFVAAGVRARSRPLLDRVDTGLTRRQVATLCLLFPLLVTLAVAVPTNLAAVSSGGGESAAANAVHVEGYTVTYAEDVRNERVGAFDVELLNESTSVNASGVIVSNPERAIWTQAISAGTLAYSGRESVRVGGVGWSDTVAATRSGWVPTGASPVYRVSLVGPDSERSLAYTSPNATASPVIDGRNVTVANTADGFSVVVTHANETLGRAPLPTDNGTATAGGLGFGRVGNTLVAARNGTRVTVATRETYS